MNRASLLPFLLISAYAFGDTSAPTADLPPPIPGEENSVLGSPAPGPTADAATNADASKPSEPQTTSEADSQAPPETASAPPPASESTPEAAAQSQTRYPFEDAPEYQRTRPRFGAQVDYSHNVFGNTAGSNDLLNGLSGSRASSFGVGLDWQPAFLQSIGVFALGLRASVLAPVNHASTVTRRTGLWSGGVQAKYQFRYFREQPVVPYVGLALDDYFYSIGPYSTTPASHGIIPVKSTLLGALLLLNWMEPSSAHELFADWGITRTYLGVELKHLNPVAGQPFPRIAATALHGELRFEFR